MSSSTFLYVHFFSDSDDDEDSDDNEDNIAKVNAPAAALLASPSAKSANPKTADGNTESSAPSVTAANSATTANSKATAVNAAVLSSTPSAAPTKLNVKKSVDAKNKKISSKTDLAIDPTSSAKAAVREI